MYLQKEYLTELGRPAYGMPFVPGNQFMSLINQLDFYSLIIKPI